MKRTLLSVMVVLAAVTVFFAACQDPVNPEHVTTTIAEETASLTGPSWVKAIAYPGAVHVSWAFNKDASSYHVYRQRTDGGDALKKLDDWGGYYLDIVGTDNQLKNGVSYTYYVTTDPKSGNQLTPRAVDSSGNTLIASGSASATVTAKVPARVDETGAYTLVTSLVNDPATEVLNAAAITEKKVKVAKDGSDNLLLTWLNYNPAFSYLVKQELGNLTLNTSDYSDYNYASPGNDATFAEVFYDTPLFGGTNKVKILVRLGNDNYYYEPVEIVKDLAAYTQTVFDNPYITGITRFNNGANARLTVSLATGTVPPNVTSADYKFYRIEAKGATTGYYNFGTAVEVVGTWTAVTIGANFDVINQSSVTVQDPTALDPTKSYIYALYVEKDGKTSETSFYGLGPVTTLDEPAGYVVTPSFTPNDDGTRTYQVTIAWSDDQAGVTYTLQRASKTDAAGLGSFTAIAIPATAKQAGRYTVIDNPTTRAGNYVYRLIATRGTITSYFDETLSSAPYTETVNLSLSAAASTEVAYAIEVQVGTGGGYAGDLTADIYRAEVPASGTSIEKAAFVRIGSVEIKDNDTYLDTDRVLGTEYYYRVTYKLGARELVNTNTILTGSAGVKASSATSTIYNVNNVGSNTVGATTTHYFEVTDFYAPRVGSQVALQRRVDSPNPPSGNWTVVTVASVIKAGASITSGSALDLGGVTPNMYYFQITEPSQSLRDNNQFRFVAVNLDGNASDTDDGASTVSEPWGNNVLSTW